MRRCLGDHDLKGEGLIADPEVTCRELGPGDQFVVAATDGLWDKCDNTEAVNIIHDTGVCCAVALPCCHACLPLPAWLPERS
jgi:serine/threonine protein phosphatase PrpC